MVEEWRDIEGYEGKYMVSSLGRVKSMSYNKTGKEKIRKQVKNRNGYLQVALCKNGKMCMKSVHRLVAIAFIPNPKNLPQVNHKDENKENNCVSNLEWISQKDNLNYGTARERTTKKISKPVLCVETGVIFPSSVEAALHSGVHRSNINNCCLGKRKTSCGLHWQFAENNENIK